MSIPSSHKKLRMLCVGPHNLYYSRSIGYKIKSQHHNYVDTIDYCTAYELSSIDLRKYDYLLTTEPAEALPAQTILPVLELQYFLGWKDLYDFRNQVILPQISTETLFHESSLAAFDQLIDCDSLDEFVAWASRRQTQNSEARIQAMIRYNTLLPILPANGTVALYCSFLPPGTGWNTRLFKFVNPIRHGSQTVPYAIVCAIPLNFDTNILKVTDSLLRRVLLDENRLLTVPE